jgi:small subunit ribosomal protein S16
MAVKIRLTRRGRTNRPFYRIVVMDESEKRDGKTIDSIGFYNPETKPETVQVDRKKLDYWQSKGAKLTDGVKKIINL